MKITDYILSVVRHKLVRTTVGRLLFNEGIPQDLGFVDRSDPEQTISSCANSPPVNKPVTSSVSCCACLAPRVPYCSAA